jgi:hypothetical protein
VERKIVNVVLAQGAIYFITSLFLVFVLKPRFIITPFYNTSSNRYIQQANIIICLPSALFSLCDHQLLLRPVAEIVLNCIAFKNDYFTNTTLSRTLLILPIHLRR